MADENVLIYATGPDGDMRAPLFSLLQAKIAIDVDRIDQGSLLVTDSGKEKLSSSGVAFTIVTKRENIERVFEALRRIEGVRAYALPILATMS